MTRARKLLEQLLNEKEKRERDLIVESEQRLNELRESINDTPTGVSETFQADFLEMMGKLPISEDTMLRNEFSGVSVQQSLSEYDDYLAEREVKCSEYQQYAQADSQKFARTEPVKAQFWSYISQLWQQQRASFSVQRAFINRLLNSLEQ